MQADGIYTLCDNRMYLRWHKDMQIILNPPMVIFAMGGFNINRYLVLCLSLSFAVRYVFVLLLSMAIYFLIG